MVHDVLVRLRLSDADIGALYLVAHCRSLQFGVLVESLVRDYLDDVRADPDYLSELRKDVEL